MQNGASYHHDTIADIKANAKDVVYGARGASATNLLNAARSQIRVAQVRENEGDYKGAFSCLSKAALLVQLVFDSSELKAESQVGRKGALFKDFMEFQQVCTFVASNGAVFLAIARDVCLSCLPLVCHPFSPLRAIRKSSLPYLSSMHIS